MKTTLENARIWAIREIATGLYAREDDDGSVSFGPLAPDTLFFVYDERNDDEKLFSTMSACPGGHEAVEQVEGYLSVTI